MWLLTCSHTFFSPLQQLRWAQARSDGGLAAGRYKARFKAPSPPVMVAPSGLFNPPPAPWKPPALQIHAVTIPHWLHSTIREKMRHNGSERVRSGLLFIYFRPLPSASHHPSLQRIPYFSLCNGRSGDPSSIPSLGRTWMKIEQRFFANTITL